MRYKLGIATLFVQRNLWRHINQNSLQQGISVHRPSWELSEGDATSGFVLSRMQSGSTVSLISKINSGGCNCLRIAGRPTLP